MLRGLGGENVEVRGLRSPAPATTSTSTVRPPAAPSSREFGQLGRHLARSTTQDATDGSAPTRADGDRDGNGEVHAERGARRAPGFNQDRRRVEAHMRKYVTGRLIREFLLGALATYGGLWMVVESISAFFASLSPRGFGWYGLLLFLSVLGGLYRAVPTRRIEFPIPGSNSSFEIQYGDIFDGSGAIVIPVNEYFDGMLGDHVSERSLHGKFIKNVLAGQAKTFEDLTSDALTGVRPEEQGVSRPSGRRERYAIGTVACLDLNDKRYLLVVLSRTDPMTLKASATALDLWRCLEGVWQGVRDYSNGRSVRIPLIGAGLSGTGLPPRNLIEIIATSFLYYNKRKWVAGRVSLVLQQDLMNEVDLKSIERSW